MRTPTCQILGPALAMPFVLAVASARGGSWWIEAGPAVRGGMTVKIGGSSYAQTLGVHAAPAPLAESPAIGSLSQYADRVYSDGYVKLDAGTLNPNAIGGPGNTWNWAYDNNLQYDPARQSLAFSALGQPGYTTLQDCPTSLEEDALGAGLNLAAGYHLKTSNRWQIDLVLGFQGIWGAEARADTSTYLERISRLATVDSFDVTDTVNATGSFPGPQTAAGGYAGAYNVPGPTLTNVPTSRTSNRQDLSLARNTVHFRCDTDLYELTLGPRFRYAATQRLSFDLTPKLGVSYLDVLAQRSEVFANEPNTGAATTLGSWQDRSREGAFRFAAGITAGADLDLGAGFSIAAFGGYEWTVNDVRIDVGPSYVDFDGSGFVAGAALRKRF
jgi:hypothetical protein